MADLGLTPPSIADQRTLALVALLDRLDALPLGVLENLYDPDLCHEAALPLLAREFGVLDEAWTLAGTVAARRSLVRQALQLQMRRGTPWALKQALAAVGWPGMQIVERSSHWAKFKVVQPLGGRAVPQAELDRLLPTIDAWKPARCVLESIEFGVVFESSVPGTGPHHDGVYVHDGAIKYEGLTLANIAYIKIGAGSPTVRINGPSVVDQGSSLLITFTVDGATANGVEVDTFAIYSAADTEIARATAPKVTKTSAITLAVSWTLHKV
jgi:phage tail P2-like protein